MPLPQQPWVVWRACITVFHIFALLATCFRIWYRHKKHGLWWDDFMAIVAFVLDLSLVVALWHWQPLAPKQIDHTLRTIIFWFSSFAWVVETWSARLSLALSIARIFPPDNQLRRLTLILVPLFIMMAMIIIIETAVFCAQEWAFDINAPVQCHFPRVLNVTSLSFDLLSDTILIFCSTRLMWRVRLPIQQKRLVAASVFSSIWMTLGGIGLGVLMLGPRSWGTTREILMIMMACTTAGLALLCCNLLVLVTCAYKALRYYRRFVRSSPEGDESQLESTRTRPITSDTSGPTPLDTHRQREFRIHSQARAQVGSGATTSIILTDVETGMGTYKSEEFVSAENSDLFGGLKKGAYIVFGRNCDH